MRHRDFNPGQPFPSAVQDAIFEFLSMYISPNLMLSHDGTNVTLNAGSSNNEAPGTIGQVSIAIGGTMRWRTTPTTVAVNGAAGLRYIWVMGPALNPSQEDAGTFDYTFTMAIRTAAEGTPATGGQVARCLGYFAWSGTAITTTIFLYQQFHKGLGSNSVTGLVATANDLDVRAGATSNVLIGARGGTLPGVRFGSTPTNALEKDNSNVLHWYGGRFSSVGANVASEGSAGQMFMGDLGATFVGAVTPGLFFGPALDTVILRSAPNTLFMSKTVQGSGTVASDAFHAVIRDGNAYEWGHTVADSLRNTLGVSTDGLGFLAFHGERGTNAYTFRSRGIKASIMRADGVGGMLFGNLPSASGDNQTPASTLYVRNDGLTTVPGAVIGSWGGTDQVAIGQIAAFPAIVFGSAQDSYIRRTNAAELTSNAGWIISGAAGLTMLAGNVRIGAGRLTYGSGQRSFGGVIIGVVQSNGTINLGSGFDVTRPSGTGNGIYQITFNPGPFPGTAYAPMATSWAGGGMGTSNANSNGFTVFSAGGSDVGFSFAAIFN